MTFAARGESARHGGLRGSVSDDPNSARVRGGDGSPDVTRRFTVAVFVVHRQRLLLLFHRKLQRWLPPGGHIEPNETPDDAALREVWEETGIGIELVGEQALRVQNPRQLVIPQGVQVEPIRPGLEHIDFVYFGRPTGGTTIRGNDEAEHIGWYDPGQVAALPLTAEMRLWVRRVWTYWDSTTSL